MRIRRVVVVLHSEHAFNMPTEPAIGRVRSKAAVEYKRMPASTSAGFPLAITASRHTCRASSPRNVSSKTSSRGNAAWIGIGRLAATICFHTASAGR